MTAESSGGSGVELRALEAENAELRKRVEGIRPEVLAFAQLMEKKLKANEHKGGWENESFEDLHYMLEQEVDEVWQAKKENGCPLYDLPGECADVANFAMMIADNAARPPNQGE